jgi:hypothetical protein
MRPQGKAMSITEFALQLMGYVGMASLLIYPIRRIFRRAGLNPNYGFLIFFPYAGLFIVTGILALTDWPVSIDNRADKKGLQ